MSFSREMKRDHWRMKEPERFAHAVQGHRRRTRLVLCTIRSLIQLFPLRPNAIGG